MENKINKNDPDGMKELIIGGDVYKTRLTKKYERRQKWTKPDKNQVISFIPGTVREVFVREGDMVKADDKLMVLEAMKMMNTIYAPVSGKIKSVLVKAGDRTPKGTLMIVIE